MVQEGAHGEFPLGLRPLCHGGVYRTSELVYNGPGDTGGRELKTTFAVNSMATTIPEWEVENGQLKA